MLLKGSRFVGSKEEAEQNTPVTPILIVKKKERKKYPDTDTERDRGRQRHRWRGTERSKE